MLFDAHLPDEGATAANATGDVHRYKKICLPKRYFHFWANVRRNERNAPYPRLRLMTTLYAPLPAAF